MCILSHNVHTATGPLQKASRLSPIPILPETAIPMISLHVVQRGKARKAPLRGLYKDQATLMTSCPPTARLPPCYSTPRQLQRSVSPPGTLALSLDHAVMHAACCMYPCVDISRSSSPGAANSELSPRTHEPLAVVAAHAAAHTPTFVPLVVAHHLQSQNGFVN